MPALKLMLGFLLAFYNLHHFSSRARGLITAPANVLVKFLLNQTAGSLSLMVSCFFLSYQNIWTADQSSSVCCLASSTYMLKLRFFWDILGLVLQALTVLVYLLTSIWGPIITSWLASCVCCQATRTHGVRWTDSAPRESSCWEPWAIPRLSPGGLNPKLITAAFPQLMLLTGLALHVLYL